MYLQRIATILLIALLAVAVGCDNGTTDDDDDLECRDGAVLTAQIGSFPFNPVCVVLTIDAGNLSIAGLTNIDGSDGSQQHQINITLPGATEGTFPALQAMMTYAQGDDPANLFMTVGISGQLVISELSAERVRGTFSFSGPESDGQGQQTGNTVNVTNGSFNIPR